MAPLRWRQPLAFVAVCCALATVYLGGYPANGGFVADDWGQAARTAYAGSLGDEIRAIWPESAKRPGLAVYNPVVYRVFGPHPARHHVWVLFLSLLAVTAFFALLRELRVPILWSGLAGLLALFYPHADALRLWVAVGYGNLSLAFAFTGLAINIRALRMRPSARRTLLLIASSVLFAASLALYEVTAGLIAASGLIALAAGIAFRGVWRKWVADLALTGFMTYAFTLGHMVPHQPGVNLPKGGSYLHDRLYLFRDQALELASKSVPLLHWWPPLLLAALTLLLTLAGGPLIGRDRPSWRSDARFAPLATAAAGLAVIAVAYAVFVPADPFYFPLAVDTANRVNALAAYGYVLVLVGAAWLLGTLLCSAGPRAARIAMPVAALALMTGVLSYAGQVHTEAGRYDKASDIQDVVVRQIYTAVQPAPSHRTVFAFGYQGAVHPDLPVFVHPYDLAGALRLRYDDPTIDALPVRDSTQLVCDPRAVVYAGTPVPYPRVLFVNVASRVARTIRSQRQCTAAVRSDHFPQLW